MRAQVVTGYIPLQVLNCSEQRFRELGSQLKAAVPGPYTAYDAGWTPEMCWMYKFIQDHGKDVQPQWPELPADRFATPKDAVLSDIVMHQKYEWLALAAIADPLADVFVWIDYGVMKQPGMTAKAVTEFLKRVEAKDYIGLVEAPGIRPIEPVDDSISWDRFCGSVVIVPRGLLFMLCRAMKVRAMKQVLDTGKITIESNTLAHVELAIPEAFRWYPAWWGATMFTNY